VFGTPLSDIGLASVLGFREILQETLMLKVKHVVRGSDVVAWHKARGNHP
jgi:hypothetical protein